MSIEYYVGRQPIFDAETQVVGYELLYRPSTDSAEVFNADRATSNVILNLLETGLDEVVGDSPAYINVTKQFIIGDILPSRIIKPIMLELQQDISADNEVIESIHRIKSLGYMIALDNLSYKESIDPLFQLANVVKIDIQAQPIDTLKQAIANLKNYSAKTVAMKVETPDELQNCKSLGFDYFQGFFFSQPQVLKGTRLSQNRLVSLRLLQELNSPRTKIEAIERTLKIDVTLSYKLLRYINSASIGLQHKIKSIRHAIVLLGTEEIKRWAHLIVIADISDKPNELTVTALIRAKMCELLAVDNRHGDPEIAFVIGLFSTLDSMMNTPLQDLLNLLPIDHEIIEALIDKKGIYSKYMDSALAYETAKWSKIEKILQSLQ